MDSPKPFTYQFNWKYGFPFPCFVCYILDQAVLAPYSVIVAIMNPFLLGDKQNLILLYIVSSPGNENCFNNIGIMYL